MTKDEKYIRRCIQLARNGMCNAAPNPMVGAVIVCNDRIIGEGTTYVAEKAMPKSTQSVL